MVDMHRHATERFTTRTSDAPLGRIAFVDMRTLPTQSTERRWICQIAVRGSLC